MIQREIFELTQFTTDFIRVSKLALLCKLRVPTVIKPQQIHRCGIWKRVTNLSSLR